MVDSVNAFILADKKVSPEDISKQMEIFEDTAHKIGHVDLAFSKVRSRRVSPRKCKASQWNKSIGKHRFGWEQLPRPLYSPDMVLSDFHLFQKVSVWNKSFKRGWSGEQCEQLYKDFHAEIIQKLFFQWENVFKKIEIMLKNKVIFFLCEMGVILF